MKKISALFLMALMVFSITFTGCKKDEDKVSSFTYDGETYETPNAVMMSMVGTPAKLTSIHYLILSTEGLAWDVTEEKIAGEGDIVVLMFGSTTEELATGSYSYASENFDAFAGFDFNTTTQTGTELGLAEGGPATADVTKSGDSYEIEYELTLETNKVLKGSYSGTPTVISSGVSKMMKIYSFER